MSFYALVKQGKVLGFRDHIDEQSLGLAERTAAVMLTDEPISIYEVEGRMPQEADVAMRRLTEYLSKHPELEPVCVVDFEAAGERESQEDDDTLYCDNETTGCYERRSGVPGESGFFAPLAVVG